MKKLIVISLLIAAASLAAVAQGLQISPLIGYTFADKFTIDRGTARLGDGLTYGGALTFGVNQFYDIELSYLRQDAEATAYSDYYSFSVREPISTNYILIGGSRLVPVSEQAVLFSGVNLGAGFLASKDDTFNTITRFAVGFQAGVKYFFIPNLGLRLQANLNFPIVGASANLWWSPGSGVSAGVSSYLPIIQFGFNGGLIFKLN